MNEWLSTVAWISNTAIRQGQVDVSKAAAHKNTPTCRDAGVSVLLSGLQAMLCPLTLLVINRLVRQQTELITHPCLVRQNLDHKDANQIFFRVDPEFGAGCSAPVKCSF